VGIDQTALLPDEAVVLTKKANAVLRPADYGLAPIANGRLMKRVGMSDREAVGGQLYLTNYRLLFQAHPLNRFHGTFSIFLPTIREVLNASSGVTRQVEIVTGSQRCAYVVWGVTAVIAAIERGRAALDPAAVEQLAVLAAEHRDMLGEGLEPRGGAGRAPVAGTAPTALSLRELLSLRQDKG
jgi:hypothetical protein